MKSARTADCSSLTNGTSVWSAMWRRGWKGGCKRLMDGRSHLPDSRSAESGFALLTNDTQQVNSGIACLYSASLEPTESGSHSKSSAPRDEGLPTPSSHAILGIVPDKVRGLQAPRVPPARLWLSCMSHSNQSCRRVGGPAGKFGRQLRPWSGLVSSVKARQGFEAVDWGVYTRRHGGCRAVSARSNALGKLASILVARIGTFI